MRYWAAVVGWAVLTIAVVGTVLCAAAMLA